MPDPQGALILQSDSSVLLDLHAPRAEEARAAILPFAELEKSPEHMHSYRISPLSLWNAAAAGLSPETVLAVLSAHSRYAVPRGMEDAVRDAMSRYGRLVIRPIPGDSEHLALEGDEEALAQARADRKLGPILEQWGSAYRFAALDRGKVKLALGRLGWPARDEAPLRRGAPLPIRVIESEDFRLRPYQREALAAFAGDLSPGTGYGVVVLPCGAGKTVVGMAAMERIGEETLVLTTNGQAARQWIDELSLKTDIPADAVGEYSGARKEIRPVTVATYQIMTWRPGREEAFPHLSLFRARDWGLVIYDEAHLLPAPVFRVTAEIQATRRLGLTATLVREDGLEADVFTLIGPKRYDAPWRELEAKGFIAEAVCREIRVRMPKDLSAEYAGASMREKHRIAAENPAKLAVARELLMHHRDDQALVIGQYLDQLKAIAKDLKLPLITGATPGEERERLYRAFREGSIHALVVSKVANFAIDLPDASVAIQVSGGFGSRQEEAQRLGRILRPKEKTSRFYTLVSEGSVEELCSAKRRQFLAEQGYRYEIARAGEVE